MGRFHDIKWVARMSTSKTEESRARRMKRRATVIFRRGDHILFVRKPKAKWNLPGGRVELNETPIQAAYREMSEETGINLGHLIYIWEYKDSDITHYLFESSAALPGEPKASNEISDCRWFTIKELRKRNVNGAVKTLLKRWTSDAPA